MSAQKNKFYLTTPIYYVNARPHIGHAYTTIVADVLARRHRLLGDDTFFLTGTDEHGQKIERSAAAAGIPPKQFADQVSSEFRNLWDRMGLTYNRFIRTTDPHHIQGAQKLFADLYARGQIYLSSYTGQYSIGEEMFVEGPPGTLGPDGRPTETVTEENFFFRLSDYQAELIDEIVSGRIAVEPPAQRNEILAFLRGGRLEESYSNEPYGIDEAVEDIFEAFGESEAKEITVGISKEGNPYRVGALKDLSVSRSSFAWGIPVPEDILHAAGTTQKHVIYVWLDALANYMTAIGYGSADPQKQAEFNHYWPADLHLVGKEITRFHCVYWPAFLLALNPALLHSAQTTPPADTVILSEAKDPRISPAPPHLSTEQHQAWATRMLPKQITAHGWLLFDNSKMSKSKGNIVRTETILDAFGDHVYGKQFPDSTKAERDLFASDVLRYFLLREIPFGQDGSFSFDALITRYNADLANGYGNLVSRTLTMIEKYFSGSIPERSEELAYEIEKFHHAIESTKIEDRSERKLTLHLNNLELYSFMQGVAFYVSRTDNVLSAGKPWKDKETAAETDKNRRIYIYYAAESIRIITALLYPILPFATAQVWAQLGLGDIELAARNGELTDLQWGGLKSGTKLGPLAPIFPRADKGLADIMTNMEENKLATGNWQPATDSQTPDALTAQGSQPAAQSQKPETATTDPAAGPRTASLDEPASALPVGGSTALTTGPHATPSHTEAPASGIFAPQPAPAAAAAPLPSEITIDDFAKIELRVAQILVAERIPKADKLLRLEVDLGPNMPKRQILSGIAEWYTPEDLIGRRIVVITNLAPRKMRGLESHGMLLAASADTTDGKPGKPILATMAEDIALGSRLK